MDVARIVNTVLPACVMIMVMSFFSLYTVLMKKAMHDGSNPLVLALLREALAVSVLLPFAYTLERRKGAQSKFWPAREDAGSFFLLGALMIWCVQLLSALSLNFISANSYALMAPSVPVFCLIVSMFMGFEKFDRSSRASWLKMAAICVTVAGAIFIAVSAFVEHGQGGSRDKNPLVGFAYLMVNKLAIGAYPNLEKTLFAKYPTHVVVSWGYTTGALLTLMSAATCATDAESWRVSPSGWGAILYAALVSSAFNYQAMAWVNQRTSPVTVMAFYPLQSVATPVLAFLILGATFNPRDAVGGLLIIGGLGCLMYARFMEGHGLQVGDVKVQEGNDQQSPPLDPMLQTTPGLVLPMPKWGQLTTTNWMAVIGNAGAGNGHAQFSDVDMEERGMACPTPASNAVLHANAPEASPAQLQLTSDPWAEAVEAEARDVLATEVNLAGQGAPHAPGPPSL